MTRGRHWDSRNGDKCSRLQHYRLVVLDQTKQFRVGALSTGPEQWHQWASPLLAF